MAEYTEEVRGILSLPLYDAETCRPLVEQVNESDAWSRAEVSLLNEGGYRSVVMEERSASVFAPLCGKAVIFPSTYLHRAEPVTRGRKYVIVSRLTGRQPIRRI